MKKVLITGGAGFIGSHIVDKLIMNDYKVVIIDNLLTGSINNLPQSDKIEFYKNDIYKDDIEFIFDRERPDFCIHLAAQTSVAYSEKEPVYDANLNIVSSIKILELCKKYNVKKFLTASSAAVYGMPKTLPITEEHSTKPISFYGISKLTMEKYIELFNVPYVIFRFSNVYGPRQFSSKESGVIAIFHDAMLNNKDINIFDDGTQIRDFLFVKDIAQIVLLTIESDIVNKTYNFSSNTGININKLFEMMKDLYQYKKSPNYLPPRIGDIKDSILDNFKIKSVFKEFKSTSLEDGLKELFNFSKNCELIKKY